MISAPIIRRLLIIAPLVLALILVSLLLPARQVSIEGIGKLSFETKVTLSVGSEVAYASPGGMKQVIIGGYNSSLSATGTQYNAIAGGYTWTATVDYRRQVVSTSGTLKNLFVELSAAPGIGRSYTITVMKDDVATALTVTISGTATAGSDFTNSVSVVAGDTIYLRSTPSGTPTTTIARWSVMFEGSNSNESLILGVGNSNASGIRYVPISQGAALGTTATENQAYQIIPTAGIIKNLYVRLSVDPGTSPDAYRITLRKNGTSTSLIVTITADATTANNTVDQVSVAAGDYVNLMIEPLNAPSATPVVQWGMTFVADTDGESLILGQSSATPSTSATQYNYLVTTIYSSAWGGTESSFYQGGQGGATLRKLYVRLSATPGTGKSYQIQVRRNGGNSGISVIVFDLNTTGNDTTNTCDLSNFDDLDISCTPNGIPTAAMVYWGLVCYIPPCSPNISNSPDTHNFGLVSKNSTYETELDNFAVTNNSGGAIDISIRGTDMTDEQGGTPWTLSDTCTPGPDTYGLMAGLEVGGYSITVKKNSPFNNLVENLSNGATQKWGLKLYTPTEFSDGFAKSGTVTLTATCR